MKNLFLYYIILVNTISFLLMYIDKQRAIKNMWRIKESTLFFLSIIGGSIGALMGINLFRHKTKHLKFTIGIPIIIILQLVFLFILPNVFFYHILF